MSRFLGDRGRGITRGEVVLHRVSATGKRDKRVLWWKEKLGVSQAGVGLPADQGFESVLIIQNTSVYPSVREDMGNINLGRF